MFQARIFSSHFRHNFTSTKTTLLRKKIVLRTLTRTTTTIEQGSQFPFVIPKERAAENMAAGSISPSSMLTLEQEQLLELKANQKPTGENNKMEAVAKQVGQQYIPGLLTNFFTKIAINRNFHPQHKMILRESATKLYESCANGSNYILLHKEFGMPDNFFSWYRLTLLHIWMGLVRMQQSLEANSFCLFRSQVTNLFHKDAMERYKAFYEDDHYAKQQRNKRFKLFYRGVFIHTFFELDEGFLLDDRNFAGAIWRSIFVFDENVEIVHLNRAVRYIRSVLHHLDTLDTDKILMEGIEIWNLEMSQIDEEIFQRQQNKQQIKL